MKKKTIAASVVMILFLLLAGATPALADGGFFIFASIADLYQADQKAVILYESGTGNSTQHLILSVSFEGDAESFAWVVPVPGIPEIAVTDAELFRELSKFTVSAIPGGSGLGCGASAPPPDDGIDVIAEEVVGPYATAILSATNATVLADWLNANGYLFPEEGEDVIAGYIEQEWYFVAMKMNVMDEGTGQALAEGAIEPIVLSFATEEMVYPMRITALSAVSPQVLLYVFSDRVVVPREYAFRVGYLVEQTNVFTLEFGDRVSLADLSGYEVLSELLSTYLSGDEFYLTKLRSQIDADMMVDIGFVEYEELGSLQSLAQDNTQAGNAVLLTIIFAPVLGLYFWQRRRSRQ
jgi:hypothetical protein